MSPSAVNILLVEDNPGDVRLVKEALMEVEGWLFDLASVETLDAALTHLAHHAVDVILLDLTLPDSTGFETFYQLNSHAPQVAIILLTGMQDETLAARAVQEGAQDYLVKGQVEGRLLTRSIRYAIERKHAEEALKFSAAEWRTTFDAVSIGICLLDENHKILRSNQAMVTMFSKDDPEILGKPCWEVVHGTTQPIPGCPFIEAQRSLRRVTAEYQRDGRWFEGSVDPILDAGGQFAGVVHLLTDITERKRAELEIQRRLTDLRILYEGSQMLSGRLSLPEIGRKVVEIILKNLDWPYAAVRIRKPNRSELELIGFGALSAVEKISARDDYRLASLPHQTVQGMIDWVMQNGQVVRSGDLPADPRTNKTYAGLRSGMYAPLMVGEEIIGVISIESAKTDAFNDNDERLLATIAKVAADAVHRNRLQDQTEDQLRRMAVLHTIDQAISTSFDLRLTLDILIKNAAGYLGVDAVLVLLINPVMNQLEYAAGFGFRSDAVKKIHTRIGERSAGRVAVDRQMISIADLSLQDGSLMHPELIATENFMAYNAVPLVIKGQVKGVLETFKRSCFEPDPEWLSFLMTLANEAAIAIESSQLFENLQRSNFELSIAYNETIEGWSRALELRDHETEGHTKRVTELTLRIADELGSRDGEIIHIRRGALLHDIGKLSIPDYILRKTGPLTDEEWDIMRAHPRTGYDMLLPIKFLRPALDIPYCHHEKWDGSGYPRGLKGEEIPLAARIFAVADVWDALTSDRPYRPAWSKERALEYLREQSGKHFDPRPLAVFLTKIQVD